MHDMHIISRICICVMRKLHKQRHKDKNTLLFLITLEHFSNQIIHSFCFQLLVISSVCSVYHCCCWPRDEDRICCIKKKKKKHCKGRCCSLPLLPLVHNHSTFLTNQHMQMFFVLFCFLTTWYLSWYSLIISIWDSL